MAFERIKNYGVVNPPQEFTCAEGDAKPLVMTDPEGNDVPIPNHSTCWEYDTKTGFMFVDGAWWEV